MVRIPSVEVDLSVTVLLVLRGLSYPPTQTQNIYLKMDTQLFLY